MEEGDFSKSFSFKKNNFNGTLYQQGRVFLDSDFNDQTKTVISWQDTAATDIIGPHVAAIPSNNINSFKVLKAKISIIDGKKVVQVTMPGQGRAWVDGILVYSHNETLDDGDTRTASFLQPPIEDPPVDVQTVGNNNSSDAVILEVWRESINAFQIPSQDLYEPALGGPDTTERIYTATAIRLFRIDESDTCISISEKIQDKDSKNKGRLLVKLQDTQITNCDCPVVKAGGFTGFEHGLYRIEIADVNDGVPRFKWSQFNGGLVGNGHFDPQDPNKIIITGNIQAIKTSGLNSFYLETKEYDREVGHWKITFGVPVILNNDDKLEIQDPASIILGIKPDTSKHDVFFRLWNEIRPISEFIDEKELVDGIKLKFENPQPNIFYLPRDFWTFSVRVGEIKTEPLIDNEPPHGIIYHQVPLAILHWNGTDTPARIEDCRKIFRPLTNLDVNNGCCTFIVGDGKSSFGDFNSIQEAIDSLNDNTGGELCILPGEYESHIQIIRKNNIKIKGCGNLTFLYPLEGPENQNAPIFNIINSENISIENLTFDSPEGSAIYIQGSNNAVQNINIHQNIFFATKFAIGVFNGTAINISNNQIYMYAKKEAGVGIFIQAQDCLIEKNLIEAYPIDEPNLSPALGGIQILGGSDSIKIFQNKIIRGSGNGITLSSFNPFSIVTSSLNKKIIGNLNKNVSILDQSTEATRTATTTTNTVTTTTAIVTKPYLYFIFNIQIQDNEITNMGLSGIGTRLSYSLNGDQSVGSNNPIINLLIKDNKISSCMQRPLTAEMLSMVIQPIAIGFGGISLETSENVFISGNTIENNGQSTSKIIFPICGICILYGSKITITQNNISNNGFFPSSPSSNSPSDFNIQPGIRGGIVVYGTPYTTFNYIDKKINGFDTINAIYIYDNIVDQPVGQALRILAIGTTSIQNNLFNSEFSDISSFGIASNFNFQGAVFISNVGKQQIRSTLLNLPLPLYLSATSVSLPKGNILFNNNQIRLGPDHKSLFSIYIESYDDIALLNNESDCQDQNKILRVNSYINGVTIRATNNRLKEINSTTSDKIMVFSLYTNSQLMNITSNNQGNDCIIAKSSNAANIPVAERDNQVLYQNNSCQRYKQTFTNKSVNLLRTDVSKNEENNRSATTTDDSTINDSGIDSNNNSIDLNRTNRFFEDLNDQIQYNRLNILKYFKDIQNTINSLLKEELKKLESIGNKDNKANAIQLDKLIKQNSNLIKDFTTELEITKIKTPITNENQILIHGRVTDKNLKGIPNLTVLLTDKKGKDFGSYSSSTDLSGYYSIIIEDNKKEKTLKEMVGKTVLYITVLSADNKVLYKLPSPIELESPVHLYDVIIPK